VDPQLRILTLLGIQFRSVYGKMWKLNPHSFFLTGFELRGLHLQSRLSTHLSYTSSSFCSGYFGDGVSGTISLDWPWIEIFLISASQIAGITSVSHQLLALILILNLFMMKLHSEFKKNVLNWVIFSHCWWEWQIVWPLWKTVGQFLAKLNLLLTMQSSSYTPW
jgi:hypothetical protein